MHVFKVRDFDDWRKTARQLLSLQVPPDEVIWTSCSKEKALFKPSSLVDLADLSLPTTVPKQSGIARVPKQFIDQGKLVACHRNDGKWELLYRLLWRISKGEPSLLQIVTDEDVHGFSLMAAAVKRDAHKAKAFVRFRRIDLDDAVERYVAWHRPDHLILPLVAPFFVERFRVMNWAIFTPDASVSWDGSTIQFGAGIAASQVNLSDELEDLWKTYYASIFNPARINPKAMKREMPTRHWATLPEADLIPKLLRDAPQRTETMIASTEGYAMSAADFLPPKRDLKSLRQAALHCEGCPLYQDATQTVFGKGPSNAKVVMVGEVPGDREDREGEPFVGPAGQLLDDALRDAGIHRETVYITNAVKHFKFKIIGGGRRLHQKPGIREMKACKPWLEAELDAIQPEILVCLGATAAQSVISPDFRITKQRGEVFKTDYAPVTLATYHPSAILRAPDKDARTRMYELLVDDLQTAATHLAKVEPKLVNRDD